MISKILRFILLFSFIFVITGCMPKVSPDAKYENTNKGIFVELDTIGHMGLVMDMLVTKKQNIITASNDMTIKVWDKDLNLKRKFLGEAYPGSEGKIYTIALSPDEKYLISGGLLQKDTIRIYNYKTAKLLKVLYSHSNVIHSLSFSEDGKYLISSSHDTTVKIWDVNNNFKLLDTIEFKGAAVYNAKIIIIDNRYFALTTSSFRETSLYDMQQKKIVKNYRSKYKARTATSAHMAVSLEKKHIAVTGTGNELLILDFNLQLLKKIKTKARVGNIVYSSDGNTLLVSGGRAHVANIYSVKNSYKLKKVFSKHTDTSMAVAFLDNNTAISSGGNANEIYTWKISDAKVIDKVSSLGKRIFTVGINQNKIAWGYQWKKSNNDKKLEKVINLDDFKIKKVSSENFKFISTNNGNFILRARSLRGQSDRLDIYSKESGNRLVTMEPNNSSYNIYGWYKDYVITGGAGGTITVYDRFGNIVTFLVGHMGDVWAMAIDGDRLVSSGNDKTIKIWDLKNLEKNKNIHAILSIFIGKADEYIAYTEEGYFQSIGNSTKHIGYHINNGYAKEATWVSIDKLYDHFFRPDLVKLKLQGVDISQYTNGLTYAEVLKDPPPSVEIQKLGAKDINKKARTAKITFNVNGNDNGAVGVIRIYQEGKLVKTIGEGTINREIANADKKLQEEKLNELSKKRQAEYLAQLEVSSKSVNGTLDTTDLVGDVKIENIENKDGSHTITLPIKAGKNSISIEAFNKTNTVASYRETVTVDAKIKSRTPKIYVIAAGVNEFEQDNVSQLKYSENDARSIAKEIKNATEYKTEVTLLIGKKVTKVNLLKAIAKIKKKAHLEDKIVFYISTHGKAARGRLYLVPQNNKKLKNWINFEEIFKEIQEVAALDQIFIIDACESGQASDIMSSVYDAKASVLAKQSGVHLLMATTKGTFAFESADKNVKHGVFTNNILKALNTKTTDKNKNKKISIVELSKTLQEPQYSVEHQFPIIRNVGEDTYIKKVR